MKNAMEDQYQQLVKDGIAALSSGDTSLALKHLEEAAELGETPELLSHLATAWQRKRRLPAGHSLGKNALRDESWNSIHYLNLGRSYLLSGRRQDAIRTFRDGLLHENNPHIKEELARLGTRRYPVIASLPREHTLKQNLRQNFHQAQS